MTGEFPLAVHALAYLNHTGRTVSSEVLAKNICTNPARVRKVMARLKRADLVETREGAEGGYAFIGDPASLTLLRVIQALEEKAVKAPWRSGDVDMDCLVASGMAEVMDRVYDRLNDVCDEALGRITLAQVDQMLKDREG